MPVLTRSLALALALFALAACAAAPPAAGPSATPVASPPATPAVAAAQTPQTPGQQAEAASSACPLAEPVWARPPDDAAVQNEPAFGYYFVDKDRSIWASAWWVGQDEFPLRAGEEGNKLGWFRPAGATLSISGGRLDAEAPPLEAHIPCCYPTRFQATGLYFPTEGCWEVTATAAESELSFVVWVEPQAAQAAPGAGRGAGAGYAFPAAPSTSR